MSQNPSPASVLNENGEVCARLADGWSLVSGVYEPDKPGALTSGEYVRLVRPDGSEALYWDQSEWTEDPALVMGAIINSAAGLRLNDEVTETVDADTAESTSDHRGPDHGGPDPEEQVHVLSIHHEHGPDVTVHRTRESAEKWLAGYVAQWWADEMEMRGLRDHEDLDLAMPEDPKAAVDLYFQKVEGESYSIEAMLVL